MSIYSTIIELGDFFDCILLERQDRVWKPANEWVDKDKDTHVPLFPSREQCSILKQNECILRYFMQTLEDRFSPSNDLWKWTKRPMWTDQALRRMVKLIRQYIVQEIPLTIKLAQDLRRTHSELFVSYKSSNVNKIELD